MGCLTTSKSIKVLIFALVLGGLVYVAFWLYAYRETEIKLEKIKEHFRLRREDEIGQEESTEITDNNTNNGPVYSLEYFQLLKIIQKERRFQILLGGLWEVAMLCCAFSGTSFDCEHKTIGFVYFGLFSIAMFTTSVLFAKSYGKTDKSLNNQINQINEFAVL